jgi:hypothetical protein
MVTSGPGGRLGSSASEGFTSEAVLSTPRHHGTLRPGSHTRTGGDPLRDLIILAPAVVAVLAAAFSGPGGSWQRRQTRPTPRTSWTGSGALGAAAALPGG